MNMEIYIYEIKLNCPDRCFWVLLAGISSFWLQDFFYIYYVLIKRIFGTSICFCRDFDLNDV